MMVVMLDSAACRRNEKARNFLLLLRQSQLFEVFVRERLEMCAKVVGGPEFSGESLYTCSDGLVAASRLLYRQLLSSEILASSRLSTDFGAAGFPSALLLAKGCAGGKYLIIPFPYMFVIVPMQVTHSSSWSTTTLKTAASASACVWALASAAACHALARC